MEEPPQKRTKMEHTKDIHYVIESILKLKSSAKNLTPIIREEFTVSIPNIDVYIAKIKNRKDISNIILALNERCPLNELQHLKRVWKSDIIIAKSSGGNIENYVSLHLNELFNMLENYRVVKVPSKPPKLKWQFELSNKVWPCNFHPNNYYEKLFSGSFFTEKELSLHRTYMEAVLEIAKHKMTDDSSLGASIVVDPVENSIVAANADNRHRHPLQHAAILAIDNVASTQGGGSWDESEFHSTGGSTFSIDQMLLDILREKFPQLKFGVQSKIIKDKGQSDSNGPYLCTGYHIYTLIEPCMMCSMGLVHARAKRVFFFKRNEEDGALCSKAKLQDIKSLNHHFEVFTEFA